MRCLCIQYILMDIKTSHLIQQLIFCLVRFSVSGKDVFHAQESSQPVIVHIVPERIMIVICKKQFRITGLNKFFDISVHDRIISRNPAVSLPRRIHRNSSRNIIFLYTVERRILFFEIVQAVRKIDTVHLPEKILRFLDLCAVFYLLVIRSPHLLIALCFLHHHFCRNICLFHGDAVLIICSALRNHVHDKHNAHNS